MQIANCKLQIEQPREIRRGVTLMELLIVISILVLLVAVAIPAMQPAMEGRRIREAARAINVHFGSAQNRAKELGRPCGVVIERFDTLPQCSMVLKQAEVPPPYAGDLMDSVVKLQDWTYFPNPVTAQPPYWPDGSVVLKVLLRRDQQDFSNGLVRYGDTMQINRQGPFYTIVDDTQDNPVEDYPPDANGFISFYPPGRNDNDNDGWIDSHVLTLVRAPSPAQAVPWPSVASSTWSGPLPFEIFRQPVTSTATPTQLPAGAVIDLEASGSTLGGSTLKWPEPVAPDDDISAARQVIVMFSPNGSVDRLIYYEQVANSSPPPPTHHYERREVPLVDPLFLLVGKREKIPPTTGEENWRDLTNLWITLSPQTGLVTVTEVAAGASLYESRAFAREAQSMGGR